MRPGPGIAPVTVQIVSADARSSIFAVPLLNIVFRPGTPALGVSTPLCANQSSVRHCRASGLRGWTTVSPPRSSSGSRRPRVGTLARPAPLFANPRRFGADMPAGKTNPLHKCASSRMAAGFGRLSSRDVGPGRESTPLRSGCTSPAKASREIYAATEPGAPEKSSKRQRRSQPSTIRRRIHRAPHGVPAAGLVRPAMHSLRATRDVVAAREPYRLPSALRMVRSNSIILRTRSGSSAYRLRRSPMSSARLYNCPYGICRS